MMISFVKDLRYGDDVAASVVDRNAEDGASPIAGAKIGLSIEERMSIRIRDIEGFAGAGHKTGDALVQRDYDFEWLAAVVLRDFASENLLDLIYEKDCTALRGEQLSHFKGECFQDAVEHGLGKVTLCDIHHAQKLIEIGG